MKFRRLAWLSAGSAILALVFQAWLRPSDSGSIYSQVDRDLYESSPEPVHVQNIPKELRRPEVNTFLTIPEWFLVWSSDEYADFIAARPPSEFPYSAHLGQFWSGYRAVYDSTNDRYPFNSGYHMMIMVIGASTSVEYGIKAGYENIVGRITETAPLGGPTAEDTLAESTARRYVEFIRVEPWYRFDFLTPLEQLWTETGFWGANPLRKLDRKYFLTSEYAAKAFYGWLLERAAGVAYDEEKMFTAVVVDRMPERGIDSVPELRILARNADGTVTCTVPRYQAFTQYARTLAAAGVNFLDIAGNEGTILVSAIVPDGFDDSGLRLLMRQPVTTRPGRQRIVMMVPVRELAATLRRWDRPPLSLEHVYDY